MRFAGFYGNEAAREQLSGMFDSGRVPHAILIDGPAGSGKRTLARIIAQACLCVSPGEKPCGVCGPCRKVRTGNHPDIIPVQAGGGARPVPVAEIRRMRSDAQVMPNEAGCKVYIIVHVHLMNEAAQNALLKILEEPPGHVRFLLTCVGRTRVLGTVQSRCATVTLGPVPEAQAVQALTESLPDLPRERAVRAVQLSGGLIGRAKEGLADGHFAACVALAERFVRALCGADLFAFLRLTGELEKDADLRDAFLEMLPLLFRDALAGRAGVSARLSGCGEEAERLARSFSQRALACLVQESLAARAARERNANVKLMLTSLFARLWQAVHGSPRPGAAGMLPFGARGGAFPSVSDGE